LFFSKVDLFPRHWKWTFLSIIGFRLIEKTEDFFKTKRKSPKNTLQRVFFKAFFNPRFEELEILILWKQTNRQTDKQTNRQTVDF
jgi:hypothetical protein